MKVIAEESIIQTKDTLCLVCRKGSRHLPYNLRCPVQELTNRHLKPRFFYYRLLIPEVNIIDY